MIPSYFNLFRAHYSDEPQLEPVALSSAVDWDLIKSIDPSLIDFEDDNILSFINEFPTYKLTSNDSQILSHPYSIRLFLIMQKCISAFSQKLHYYIKKVKKQEREIKLNIKKSKEYQRILDSDRNDEKKSKPEKCYSCGKRFLAVKDLYAHISKEHPYLIKSWKRIIRNQPYDRNEEIISNLRIDVNNLRQYVFEQEERYKQIVHDVYQKYLALKKRNKELRSIQNPKVTPTSKCVSTLEVRPKYTELGIDEQDLSMEHYTVDNYDDAEGPNSDEILYNAGVHAMESIKSQAGVVLQKKKKDFNNIRDAIRIHLENEIPMPVPIGDSSSGSINKAQSIHHTKSLYSEKIEGYQNEPSLNIEQEEDEFDGFQLNQTENSKSMRSNDPFMLSTTTQPKKSARFVEDESTTMTTTHNPFMITDTDLSSRNPMKSTAGKGGFVETMDNSSSRRIKNNAMLVTDDDNYYSF
ncbi:hypothetical protein M9Y10_014046 [Tritrichomonas musculus]|uniref:C2H2-type domain-containing protein n=1 Tax=Tritrichomonas musculus TaxID=1915356 RepID=A0ABR2KYF0_9EUKA